MMRFSALKSSNELLFGGGEEQQLLNSVKNTYLALLEYSNSKVVLFGSASAARMAFNAIGNDKIECFIDNDVTKNNVVIYNDKKSFLPENFISNAKEKYVYIIATGSQYYDLLKNQTIELLNKYNKEGLVLTVDEYGIGKNYNNIVNIIDNLEDEKSKITYFKILKSRFTNNLKELITVYEPIQYFCLPEFGQNWAADEVFVDCGAYVGDTVEKYLFYNGYLFSKIYAFEPGKTAFNALKNRVKRLNDEWALKENQIVCINKGVGDVDTNLYLSNGTIDMGGSFINETKVNSSSDCQICSLDNEIKDKVSFIKADIEGYELKMLKGAKNIIQKYKPKLAICLYHSPFDLFTIPLYLKKLVPDYKMKVKHHSKCFFETILYCYAE